VSARALVQFEVEGLRVLASPGIEAHARALGARTQVAHEWLSDLLAFRPRVELCVLGPEDWSRVTDFPVFGFPHFVGKRRIVVAGSAAPYFDSLFDMVRPGLGRDGRRRLRAVYGYPPDLQAFSDLLAIHELAHLFHCQAGFWFPERWLSELFCNLALEGWVAEREPGSADVLHVFPLVVAESIDPTALPVRRLARMEQSLEAGPDGPTNYGWYQQRLHVAAASVWSHGGADALRRLFARFRHGAPPEDLRTTLRDEVHPAFAEVIDGWPAR
jgi:hypothetical protein